MKWLRWVVLVVALTEGGWFAYDGGRALLIGDYVTPSSGEYAGRLGPWKHVVSAVGIEPRSTLMKTVFFVYGLVWLGVMACFAFGARWAWWAMVVLAAGSLWYLPFGTLCSIVQLVLLMLPPLRGA
jgi:hypothetical protein